MPKKNAKLNVNAILKLSIIIITAAAMWVAILYAIFSFIDSPKLWV